MKNIDFFFLLQPLKNKGIITLCPLVVCLLFYVPTRSLNFDTLPTCDSNRECSVTHLNVFRYSNTK